MSLILVSFPGSADRTVKFWDLETFELIGSSRPEVLNCIQLSEVLLELFELRIEKYYRVFLDRTDIRVDIVIEKYSLVCLSSEFLNRKFYDDNNVLVCAFPGLWCTSNHFSS